MSKIGIIAGGGKLPAMLIQACEQQNKPYFVIAFDGHTDPETVTDKPHSWERLGAAGKTIKILKSEGVTDIVMAGAIRRPSMWELRPDMKTTALFAKLGTKMLGDDGLLRAISNVLEDEGLRIVGAHEVLPDLLTPLGCITNKKPNKTNQEDIQSGCKIAKNIGQMDIGQACVMQAGFVLGVEAVEGTKNLIARCGEHKRKGEKPVLIKVKKPQQDSRLDMPAIGSETIEQIAEAGFAGIAVEAGGTMIIDRDDMIKTANKHKVFVIGVDPKEMILQ